ncbi:MAG: amino acid ABC transporter permease [Cetobacterium sp.]|uniref:amino acid ABC transporter permease n=1 Tax=Cetobacterium sp. TaxID=2071632 RepID=UPI0025E65DDC|nr:amino acid ABC transporter permease [uncultured Cetobacterium sp.]
MGDYLAILKTIFIDGYRYQYVLQGLTFSVGVTAFSAFFGVILGVLIALLRLSKFKLIAILYIDLIRGTPAVVQLLILANIVFAGFRDIPIFLVAGIAFGINSSAYVAEIIRAGIEGLDKGQMEASRALGMSYPIAMKEVIIPQAIRKILPALVSEFITLLKETSIVGFIGGVDLLRSANIITSQTYRGVEPLLLVGFIYLILVGIFTKIMRGVEKGMSKV